MSNSNQIAAQQPVTAKRRVRAVTLLTLLGWLVAGLLVADKIYAQNLNSSLHKALVRSQTERHELTQELKRMSDELEALHERLSRYQKRQTQAAATP